MNFHKSILKVLRVGEGLVLVNSTYFGDAYYGQMWTQTKARKRSTCLFTDKPILVGDPIYEQLAMQGTEAVACLPLRLTSILMKRPRN